MVFGGTRDHLTIQRVLHAALDQHRHGVGHLVANNTADFDTLVLLDLIVRFAPAFSRRMVLRPVRCPYANLAELTTCC